MRCIYLAVLALLPSCLQGPPGRQMPGDETRSRYEPGPSADLHPGQTISQGMIGVSQFETAFRSGGVDVGIPTESNSLEELPLIAGAIQEAIAGNEYIDYGWEGGATLGFVTGGGFVFASGGNGLIVAVDIDLLLVELFIGPFVSVNIGDRLRFYGGAGPVVDFASYSHEGEEGNTKVDQTSTGLGVGYYARGGAELLVGRSMLGVGYRWVDSSIALSGDMGTLDLVGSQVFLSLSMGF